MKYITTTILKNGEGDKYIKCFSYINMPCLMTITAINESYSCTVMFSEKQPD